MSEYAFSFKHVITGRVQLSYMVVSPEIIELRESAVFLIAGSLFCFVLFCFVFYPPADGEK